MFPFYYTKSLYYNDVCHYLHISFLEFALPQIILSFATVYNSMSSVSYVIILRGNNI
jgi:hypothetical protein